jgi:hypothetical protein
MATCKHGINKKYCKVCKKQSTEMTEFLFMYAREGLTSAVELVADLGRFGKNTPNVSERFSKVMDDAIVYNKELKKELKT